MSETLTVEDDTLMANGDGTYSGLDADLTPYTPADPTFGGSYTLKTPQGLTYVINAATGALETESDRNGNTLTFTSGGIFSTDAAGDPGRSLTFTRDLKTNDITAITDPRGNSIVYTYDPNTGDLVSVTDRDGNTTKFVYNTTVAHYLDHVIDPEGVTVAEFSYSSNGRVDGITDALGNTTTVTSDDSGSLNSSTTAAGGSPTAVTYDSDGNVTGTVDAAGNASSATYSGNNLTSQTQSVDGTPAMTSYTYGPNGEILSETSPLGVATYFSYNNYGQPVTSTNAIGNTMSYQYDANGNLLSTTSPNGVTTSMTYDANGNVLSTTTPDGMTTATYYPNGDVKTTTDPQETTTTNTYDADGNETSNQWTWINGTTQQVMTTTNVYDGNDQLIQTTAADATVTDTVYDSSGHPIWTDVPHQPGQPADGTETVYDTAGRVISTEQFHNVVITIKNPNSSAPTSVLTSYGTPFSVTDTVYDAQGRVQWTDDAHVPGQPCDGTLTTYDADGNANGTQRYSNVVISIGTPTSSLTSQGAPRSSTSTTYDASGNILSTTSASDAATTYQYNASGQQTEAQTTANGVTATTTTTYNAVGQVTSTTDALGNTTRFINDSDGNLVETVHPDGTFSKTVYDSNDRKVASIDQDGNETDFKYDAHGNLTTVLLPAVQGPDSEGMVQPNYTYQYDSYGNLISETDPLNNTTTYAYDAFGHKVSETLPMQEKETWSYNALGQLQSSTDFDGNTIEYQYDDQGRVFEKDEYAPGATSASVTVTYTYDNVDSNNDGGHYDTVKTTEGTTIEGTTTSYYDVNGNLVEIASPQGTINYTYDRATGEETSVSTVNTDIQYTFDLLGRMTTVKVDWLDGAKPGTSLLTTYAYDANGDLLTTDFPNGTIEKRTYYPDGRLWTITTTVAATGAVVFEATYTRDADGNIRTDDETTSTGTRSEAYTYDADGRLIEEAITDPVAGNRTLTWTYDLAGNRIASTDSGAPADQQSLTYQYNANGELTEVSGNGYDVSYRYDDDGNMLAESGSEQATYTWDLEGRMIGASVTTNGIAQTITYQYDDAGNRVFETVNGQTTTYLNDPNQAYDQVLEEYAPGGALAATYVRGLDLIFQDRTAAGGGLSYYAVDQLGSTRALTNSGGTVTDTYNYDAFGNVISPPTPTVNPYQYAGYQTDSATRLDYLRARYYDPAAGRFTSRDSYDGTQLDPITQNHYLYAGASPVDNLDPSGHLDLGSVGASLLAGSAVETNSALADAAVLAVATFLPVAIGVTAWWALGGGPPAEDPEGYLTAFAWRTMWAYDAAVNRAVSAHKLSEQEVKKLPVFWVFNSGSEGTPEIWQNDALAMAGNKTLGGVLAPNVLEYGGPGTNDTNRPAALSWARSQGIVRGTDQSLDEYPFASTTQGGAQNGLRVAAVKKEEQEIQKNDLQKFYERYGPNGRYKPFWFLVVLVP